MEEWEATTTTKGTHLLVITTLDTNLMAMAKDMGDEMVAIMAMVTTL
jgi:hypothetical protein